VRGGIWKKRVREEVVDMGSVSEGIAPERRGSRCMLEKATGLGDKGPIATLGCTVLFRGRRESVCVLDAFGGEEGR
jgi:hypothetical protein